MNEYLISWPWPLQYTLQPVPRLYGLARRIVHLRSTPEIQSGPKVDNCSAVNTQSRDILRCAICSPVTEQEVYMRIWLQLKRT